MTNKISSTLTLMLCIICLLFAKTTTAEEITYVYDDLNRLTEMRLGDGTGIKYRYDEVGNVQCKAPLGDYTVTASASEGGSISPAGTTTVSICDSQGYTITPDSGFEVSSLVVDGVQISPATTYSFTNVTANHTISANFVVQLTINTNSLPNGLIGTAYSQSLSVDGGVSPYTWSIISGSLPQGLALNNSTGAITGTPGAVGSTTFTVKVQDSIGAISTAEYSLAMSSGSGSISFQYGDGKLYYPAPNGWYTNWIPPSAMTATITCNGAGAGTMGSDSDDGEGGVIYGSCGGAGGYSAIAALTTPANYLAEAAGAAACGSNGNRTNSVLALDAISYRIYVGKKGLSGDYAFWNPDGSYGISYARGADIGSVILNGGSSENGSVTISWQSGGATLPLITTALLPSGSRNSTYSQTLTAVEGQIPYIWSIASGNLPQGLTLNASTGTISGIPTAAGASTFSVTVQDNNGNTASAAYTVSISAGSGSISFQYGDGKIYVASSNGWYTDWTPPSTGIATIVTNGAGGGGGGGSYEEDGEIVSVGGGGTGGYSAVASAADQFNYISRAAGGAGFYDPNEYQSGYAGNQAITTGYPLSQVPYRIYVGRAGGYGSSYNHNGASYTQGTGGIPGQGSNLNGSVIITWELFPTPLIITTTTLSSGDNANSYNQILSATGGVTPYTWQIISGSLPPGLALNSTTGSISGTPTTVGNSSFSIQVTDNIGVTSTAAVSISISVAVNDGFIAGSGLRPPWTFHFGGGGASITKTISLAAGHASNPAVDVHSVGTLPAGYGGYYYLNSVANRNSFSFWYKMPDVVSGQSKVIWSDGTGEWYDDGEGGGYWYENQYYTALVSDGTWRQFSQNVFSSHVLIMRVFPASTSIDINDYFDSFVEN